MNLLQLGLLCLNTVLTAIITHHLTYPAKEQPTLQQCGNGDSSNNIGAEQKDLGEDPVLLPSFSNWIVLMQRFDSSVDFYRDWTEYRNGFGSIGRGEFWLGNEKVHRLTSQIGVVYSLRIEVQTDGTWFNANYATFSLDSESNKYTLSLSGFHGTAGDSLTNTSVAPKWYHGGMSFSTWDNDNDRIPTNNCAQQYRAGWWFNNCWKTCLTCQYGDHFSWETLNYLKSRGKLTAMRMMIQSL